MKNIEFTEDQIRIFCAKNYQSVAARMTKSMLEHYDELMYKYAMLKQALDIAEMKDKLDNKSPIETI